MTKSELNKANADYWNELCGTTWAKKLGIVDHSNESLSKFDQAFFERYPYLFKYLDFSKMKEKKIMEVGLGYGTVGQAIAEAGADYTGLDIAEGPVKMMNHRLRLKGLSGKAFVGSMLECPMETDSLDIVVSIGCFHHTGNVQKCIDETYRILKPGGQAIIMVYNAYSYRQWIMWPQQTFNIFFREVFNDSNNIKSTESQRRAYDSNSMNEAAPETVFLSIKKLKKMFDKFSMVGCEKENFANIPLLPDFLFYRPSSVFNKFFIPRRKLLNNLGKICGEDIYVKVTK